MQRPDATPPATPGRVPPRARVTIREVARAAQVSVATVSRALNSGVEISGATREQIVKVAQQLGYVASARGRGLVSGKAGCVGVIIGGAHLPVFLDPFYGEVLAGIELELEARGLNLMLTSLKRDQQLLDFAAGQRVDGLLVIGQEVPAALLLELDRHLPLVLIDRALPGLPGVTGEQRHSSRWLTDLLIAQGCRSLAFLAEDLNNANFQERYLGFQDALAAAGLPERGEWVRAARPGDGGGHAAMRQVLASGLPDGVVCANDPVAVEAIRALQDAGLRVPEDVQVVGFDGIPARLHPLALTTMKVDRLRMGREAARLLLGLLDGENTGRGSVVLQPTFQPGQSVRGQPLRAGSAQPSPTGAHLKGDPA